MTEPLVADTEVVRPMLRGRLHAVAAAVAIPAGALLIAAATHAGERAAVAVFVVSIVLSFGVSAVYHHQSQPGRARAVLRRLDHSMIYVLIAGTYTAMCLLALPAAWGVPLVAAVWVGAIGGIIIKLVAFNHRGWKVVGYALYPILGWAAVAALPAARESYTAGQATLVVVGGLLYTIGFPIFLLHRPDPWPRAFGYHEIWHTLTIAACVCHFAVVASLVN